MKSVFLFAAAVALITSGVFGAGGDMGVGIVPATDGSAEHPWLIEDVSDFHEFSSDRKYWVTGVYTRMVCDIDLSGIVYDNAVIAPELDGRGEYSNVVAYQGVFDGNGHYIKNMKIDTKHYFLGLFGGIGESGAVKNLKISNSFIYTTKYSHYLGGICGYNRGTISNCEINIVFNTEGSSYVGGVCGYNDQGNVINCIATGAINGGQNQLGGLCGYNNRGAFLNCATTVSQDSGGSENGGLCGFNNFGEISNCYATGDVTGHSRLGGLCGFNYKGNISYCYSSGKITGIGDLVWALCGYSVSGSLRNCFWDIESSGMEIGYQLSGHPHTVVVTNVNGKSTGQMQIESTFANVGWNFVGEETNGMFDTWCIPDGGGYPVLSFQDGHVPTSLSGYGTKSNPYLVRDSMELKAISLYEKAFFKLENDIDLIGNNFDSPVILVFRGCFDGDGHSIYNLKIEGGSYLGLFGSLIGHDAKIENIGLENVDIRSLGYSSYVGSLCGQNKLGTISNCRVSGTVRGLDEYARTHGGLCGENDEGVIKDSRASVLVSTQTFVGGLCGKNSGVIKRCESTGRVVGLSNYAGGLSAGNSGQIYDSYSSGSVSGGMHTAGFCGANDGEIKDCYSTGNVSAQGSYTGGFSGSNFGTVSGCFWDTQTSRKFASSGGIGKSTAEMMRKATYLNWDFENVWNIDEGSSYPYSKVPKNIVSLEISGPDVVYRSQQFNVLGHFENGMVVNLNDVITWKIESDQYASVSKKGLVEGENISSSANVILYANYSKDGKSIEASKEIVINAYTPPAGKIFWTEHQPDRIMCSNMDGSNTRTLISSGLKIPYGLSVDIPGGKIYWASYRGYAIKRANLDGSQMETIVSLSYPNFLRDVAVDSKNRRIYWIVSFDDKIQSSNLDGSDLETVCSDLGWPKSIAVDSLNSKIYWTDSLEHKILRANLNGSGVEDVLSHVYDPLGLDVDVKNGKIYWTNHSEDNIKRANFDGKETETLLRGVDSSSGITLDVADDRLYFTDYYSGQIKSANLDGSYLTTLHSDLNKTHGIALSVDPYRQAELTALEISGPEEITEGDDIQFRTYALYDFGPKVDVTDSAHWSLSSDEFAAIDDSGLVVCSGTDYEGEFTVYAQYTENEIVVEAEKSVHYLPVLVSSWSVVSKKRVGRSMYEYECQIDFTNTFGADLYNVSLELVDGLGQLVIGDPDVNIGDMLLGQVVTSDDTFTITIDRDNIAELDSLYWRVSFATTAEASLEMQSITVPADFGVVDYDFDGSGSVDVGDLAVLASQWLQGGACDVTGASGEADGVVNLLDLAAFAKEF